MKATDVVPGKDRHGNDRTEDIFFGKRLKEIAVFNTDENIPTGFGLRVRPGSDGLIRTWVMQYRTKGRMARYNIGKANELSPAKALVEARKLHGQILDDGDPQGDKKERRDRDKTTLKFVVKEFLEMKSTARPNTLRALEGYLERKAKPLHSTPIDRITRKDISKLVLSVQKKSGAPSAGCFRAALSNLFAFAMTMDCVENNPVDGSYEPPTNPPGERVLSAATCKERPGRELIAIWNAAGDSEYGKIIKLLILTGCRESEVGGMCWSELDFEAGTWTIPIERLKNGTSKRAKALTLPLTEPMLAIIKSVLPRRFGTDCLFGLHGVGFTQWTRAKHKTFDSLDLKPWRVHDIRHSVDTGMNDLGVAPHIVEAILGHISGHKRGVAGVYNHSAYREQVEQAMTLWSNHITKLVKETPVQALRENAA